MKMRPCQSVREGRQNTVHPAPPPTPGFALSLPEWEELGDGQGRAVHEELGEVGGDH